MGASGRESRLVPPAPEGVACGRTGGRRCAGCGGGGDHPRPVRPGRAGRPAAPRTAAGARHARSRGLGQPRGGAPGGRRLRMYPIGGWSSPGRDGLCDNAPGTMPVRAGSLGRQARTIGQPAATGAVRGAARSSVYAARPLAWADARLDPRRHPWPCRALPEARATAPAAGGGGCGRGRPARPD